MLTATEIKKRRRLQGNLKVFGMKQRLLARELGVTDSMVSQLFSGKKKAPETFEALVTILREINEQK
jgi:transcriptional regulator with XRE-family HTH domain